MYIFIIPNWIRKRPNRYWPEMVIAGGINLLIVIVFVFCLACSCAEKTEAMEVRTDDGLSLSLGSEGEITSCRIGGRELLTGGACGGFFVADVEDIAAREVSLVPNPSFEDIYADGPAGWDVGRNWRLDRQVAHSGRASMRVDVHGANASTSGPLSIEVPVKPNNPYRLDFWLRTDGCAPTFYIIPYDAQGQLHPDYPQIPISHGRTNDDWFQLSYSFTTAFFCRKIQVYCNVWEQTGTAWVDDVSVVSLEDDYVSGQDLATGQIVTTGSGAELTSNLADMSLGLRAVYTAGPNSITVDAEIEDTSGQDRAVAVSFRLPIDASGWTWYDDIQNEEIIRDDMRYGSGRLLDGKDPTQRRTVALYPFSAMGDEDVALALAVPIDQPRVFRLCYDPNLGYFLNYEFGLTEAAEKSPGRARFQFSIYRVDPQWGFRSAAERYYESHLSCFTKRAAREGGLGYILDAEAVRSEDVVIPAFADYGWDRRESADANRRELIRLLRYTEFIGWWGWALGITPSQAVQQPSSEQAWDHVEALASGNPPDKVALSILNCGLHDRQGNRELHWEYVPEWGGYNYLCNPDPEISGLGGRINRFTLTYEREVSEVDTLSLDGMRFDNPIVFATDNFRRAHFRWADHPLAFDHVSKRPVIPLDFSSFECAKAIADDMHGRGKLLAANYAPAGYPSDIFIIGLLDIVENETLWTWPTNAKLLLQRTLAGPKIVCMSAQEDKRNWPADRIEREMKHAMFYGTFYYLSTALEPSEKWGPLTRRLAEAGWEPVTYARCPALGPMVERFGRLADRNLHFTLRNEASETKRVELDIDAETLGLAESPPGVWRMRDAQTHESIEVEVEGAHWFVQVTVPSQDTVVLRVVTAFGIALDHLSTVPDHLFRAANYRDALRESNVALECPDYESLVDSVQAAQGELTSQDVQEADITASLQSIAGALSVAPVQTHTSETVWWAERLTQCTAMAQQEVVAAIETLSGK